VLVGVEIASVVGFSVLLVVWTSLAPIRVVGLLVVTMLLDFGTSPVVVWEGEPGVEITDVLENKELLEIVEVIIRLGSLEG